MRALERPIRLLAVLAVLAAAALIGAGPASAALIRPIRFDRLSLEQGLSQSAVMDVLQDRRGYIWLATEDGLNRYDGLSFKVYRHDAADASSLPDSFVWDVEEDSAGILWIATRSGLASWDPTTDRIVRQESVGGRHIRALRHSKKDNVLWIATRDSGLLRYDVATGQLKPFAHDAADSASLLDDRVYALFIDAQERLWVGSEGGLDRLNEDGRGFTHFVPNASDPESLGDAKVRALAADSTGALWVGTSAGGLDRMDVESGRFEHFRHDPNEPSSLAHDQVRAILQDADGRLWVGTSGGLDLLDAAHGTFAHYGEDPRNPTSLADEHVLSLAQDRGGVLWVGTRLGGVHKWNPQSWQFGHVAADPDSPTGLGSGYITSFSEDGAGRRWIGTYDAGLYVMDRATGDMTAHRHDPKNLRSLGSDRVMALHHDHRGDLWIGMLDAGFDRYNTRTGEFKHYRAEPKRPESLSADGVTAIVEDRAGRLWVATYGGGLERFDPETERFTHYRHDPKEPSSLSGDRVSSVAESPVGQLWVGTMENGVNLLDPRSGRFQHFVHRPGDATSLPSDSIHTVVVDAEGGLWVGTHGGLSHLRRDATSFETFTTKNGLSSNVVYGVLSDGQARLWLSTNSGVSCLDPRTGEFTNYGVSEGLQASEFNFGAWYRSPSGELLFGGINGFNAFVPDRLSVRQKPPPVVLTSLSVGYRPLGGPADQVRQVTLGFRDKVLGLEFAALDFTSPDRNRFAYKLDGFDPEWVPLAGRPRVTYTNLNAGDYTFRLRAVDSGGRTYERPSAAGVADSEDLALPITVVPPPWRTRWAFSLYALALVAAVASVVGAQRRKDRRAAAYRRHLEEEVHRRVREIAVLTELREKERLVDFLRGFTSDLARRAPSGASAATTHDIGSRDSPAGPELDRSPGLAGRFEILDVVGHGGMGVVYRARDRKLDETVALKVLRSDILKEDEAAIERFKREIKLARRVTHRNVLRTFEFDDVGGTPFLSMEFVDGVTLKQLITSLGPFPLVPGMCIARQACLGLGAAHAQGIVHRDVKPQNMLVVPATGELKIADFGISRACEIALGAIGLTRSGTIIGTPEYVAPEQAQGRGPDVRSDVYALGVVLFEVFTGRLPFTGETPLATIVNHVQAPPPRPTAINPSIPAGLEEAIMRCLEKDPDRRFADANDLLKTLTSTVAPLELSALAAEA